MVIVVLILSIIVFVKTIGYAIYEYMDNNNKFVAIVVSIFGFIALIGQVVVEVIR